MKRNKTASSLSQPTPAVILQHVLASPAGNPSPKSTPAPQPNPPRRLGFLAGQIKVPHDFDTLFQADIEAIFYDE